MPLWSLFPGWHARQTVAPAQWRHPLGIPRPDPHFLGNSMPKTNVVGKKRNTWKADCDDYSCFCSKIIIIHKMDMAPKFAGLRPVFPPFCGLFPGPPWVSSQPQAPGRAELTSDPVEPLGVGQGGLQDFRRQEALHFRHRLASHSRRPLPGRSRKRRGPTKNVSHRSRKVSKLVGEH